MILSWRVMTSRCAAVTRQDDGMTNFAWKVLALMAGMAVASLFMFWALFMSGWTVR